MSVDTRSAPAGFRFLPGVLPGIALTAAVAWLGMVTSEWIGKDLLDFDKSPISGIMMAIVIGLGIGNTIRLPAWTKPGITFSLKRILRLGIILLGIRLSLGDVLELGALGVPLILLCVIGATLLTRWLSTRLGLSERLGTLIGIGTSICGATAIVATGPAIEAKEEELTYAVANITVFGIVAMLLYPYLGHALFADQPTSAGLFLGTAIHETAQVAGSSLIYAEMFDAEDVIDAATVTKLVRNALMALLIPLMAYRYQQSNAAADPGHARQFRFIRLFPVFILGFILLAIVRTIGDVTLDRGSAWGVLGVQQWNTLTAGVQTWAERFLAMAMAGVGLSTGLAQLRGLGLKPFYVGFSAAAAVGALSLGGVALLTALGLS